MEVSEAIEGDRLGGFLTFWEAAAPLLLRFPFSWESKESDAFMVAVLFFRRDLVKGWLMWYTGAIREKRPSSRWKHAIKYWPVTTIGVRSSLTPPTNTSDIR